MTDDYRCGVEKGKGPVIEKLRTVQLVEADFQQIMIFYIGLRKDKNAKKKKIIPKFKQGSRLN